jgi:DNA-binding MarR family transcriptional regulator
VKQIGGKGQHELGALLESFLGRVSHPRGLSLRTIEEASVTVSQIILLDRALVLAGSTPSSLAASLAMSPSSVSQMIERLVKLGFVRRVEDPDDRRQKTIVVTASARAFLTRLRAARSAEYAAGTEGLSPKTRRQLAAAVAQALKELPLRTSERGVR